MSPAQKKVVIRTFAGVLMWGYLPQGDFLSENGIDLMGVDGRISSHDINIIKTISYVRDFNLDDTVDPERTGRRSFLARPRGDGLWLKLTFRDGDVLEGLANFDITFTDSLLEDRGIFLTPPDARANTQRIFIPRAALRSLEVLGFVTSPSKRLASRPAARVTADTQTKLFGE
jgi:hypothetical protein